MLMFYLTCIFVIKTFRMKNVVVPILNYRTGVGPDNIKSIDLLEREEIGNTPWGSYKDKPNVQFSMAHNHGFIMLKYYVKEKFVRAKYDTTHDPVYKDSCVEFFISFNKDENYYNLEFNLLGCCLAAYGPDRFTREQIPVHLLEQIDREIIIRKNNNSIYSWELMLNIPITVFFKHSFTAFSGLEGRANFYKCGDELPEPHYLCWNPVLSKVPDFHFPDSFGSINFST